jgi:RHS repeat-associated protein
MEAEILQADLPAGNKKNPDRVSVCSRNIPSRHVRLSLWLTLILLIGFTPLTVFGACDGCITPIFSEWRYRAASCSDFIPSEGESFNEASIVEQVQDAIDNCPQFSGYDDTGWPATGQYFGGVCGGGTNVPKYSVGIERFNKRAITSGCGGYNIDRVRSVVCPGNTIRHYDNALSYYYDLCKAGDDEVSDDKNLGVPDNCSAQTAGGPGSPYTSGNPLLAGNPVNVAYGNKLQVETDLAPAPLTGLGITRVYNSKDNFANKSYRFGIGWRSGHDRSLTYVSEPPHGGILTDTDTVFLHRPDGKVYYFTRTSGPWVTDGDTPGSVIETASGWQYTTANDVVEDYDNTGKLTRITTVSGVITDYTYYPSNYVDTVTTSLGELLTYTYDADGRIESVTDHTGRVWKYGYDAENNLEFVTYPDGTPLDDTDNPVRQYHYEDMNFPNALTGITDERGIRYAHFEYDTSARPIASYHGQQTSVLTDRIEGVSIVYSGASRTVTNSKGFASTYTTGTQIGVALVTDITGPGCATCGNGNRSYTYDPLTNDLLSKTENGIATEYGDHDAYGNPGYMIEAVGTSGERRTDYTYDPGFQGKIASIAEPSVYAGSSKVTSYTYDDFGNRLSETVNGFDPAGNPVTRTITREYNGPLHQLSKIDGPRTDMIDISILRYYPDNSGEGNNRARLKEIEDATGTLTRSNIQYTATGKLASEDRPNGLSISYSYYPGDDRLETLTEADDTISQTTRWTYLGTGEIESITTADGTSDATTITFDYDDARRLTRITDGLGNYIAYTLDTEGNREAEDTYDSSTVLRKALTRTFDLYNRLDTTSQANEGVDYDFAPDGTLAQQSDGKGTITDFSYDDLKRLLTSNQDSGGLGAVTRYSYDVADNLTSVTDPVNGTTSYIHDDLGNLLQTTSPDTGTTVYIYDAAGNLKSRQDAIGQLFIYSYDVLNRLTGVDAPGTNDDITYGYDTCPNGSGRLCSVIPPSTILTYAYDAFGNITNHQKLAYSYDLASRVKTITYPSGAVVTYSYDAAGQVSQVDLSEGTTTTTLASGITYAPFGAVESLAYGNGATLAQGMDSAYRLTAQSVTGALDLSYTLYDTNGNLESRTDTYSSTGSFAYDALNRLDTANGPFGSRDYDYDLNGNRTNLVSDTLTTSYGYTANSNRLATGTGWSYTLDANGNTTQQLDSDGAGQLYAYNSHNRLISATDRAVLVPGDPPIYQDTVLGTYRYNGLGQRVTKTVNSLTTQYLYNTGGELMAELDDEGSVQREYIYLNGQPLATRVVETTQSGGEEIVLENDQPGTSSSGTWATRTSRQDYGINYRRSRRNRNPSTYRWTPTLTAGTYEVYAWWVAKRKNSVNVPYTIVHNGQTDTVARSHKQDGGSWQLLGSWTFDGSGDEYIEVSNANGKAAADAVRFVKQGGLVNSTTVNYVHNDHLGTPQVMTDENGSVSWRAIYDPFGNASIDDASTTTLNVRFPGQYFDQETGLHYNYFRYYDPETGRYITSDPIGLGGGPNTFAYVENNPANAIDPTGLIKLYGSWCGPNWTGGFRKSYGELDAIERSVALPPFDNLDRCCQTHDIIYAKCRTKYPCDANERQRCFQEADRHLSNCSAGVGDGSRQFILMMINPANGGNPNRSIEDYMRDSIPSSEDNAESCGCQ